MDDGKLDEKIEAIIKAGKMIIEYASSYPGGRFIIPSLGYDQLRFALEEYERSLGCQPKNNEQ